MADPVGLPADLNPHWASWSAEASDRAPDGWVDMVTDLAELQDTVAASLPSADTVREVREHLRRATAVLQPYEVEDEDRVFGRLLHLPARGQSLVPPVHITRWGDEEVEGWTRFGPFHAGHNGVVHGGALANVFDDVLGRTADLGGRPRSRTAFLHVDFRSVTPLGQRLAVAARLSSRAGRKRFLHGTLHDGDRLCAEADGLFVEMLPGQP